MSALRKPWGKYDRSLQHTTATRDEYCHHCRRTIAAGEPMLHEAPFGDWKVHAACVRKENVVPLPLPPPLPRMECDLCMREYAAEALVQNLGGAWACPWCRGMRDARNALPPPTLGRVRDAEGGARPIPMTGDRPDITKACGPVPKIKECACGRAFTRSEWRTLDFVGRSTFPWHEVHELRNCSCGSTLAIVLVQGDGP